MSARLNASLPAQAADVIARSVGAVALAILAMIHVVNLPGTLSPIPLVGAGYLGIIKAAVVVGAVMIARSHWLVWAAAGGLAAAATGGYVLTHSISGSLGDHGDVGNWRCPLGLAALSVETVLILLAAWQARTRAANRAPTPRPAANATFGELPTDADAAIRELYSRYANGLHSYVEQLGPDGASADDLVQETFSRAWRYLPHLSADDQPVRPWLLRVARNLLIDAGPAARSWPVTVQVQPTEQGRADTGLDQVLDRQVVTCALQHLSPAHQTVLVETFYRGSTLAAMADQLGIPHGMARSRLHYALHALRC